LLFGLFAFAFLAFFVWAVFPFAELFVWALARLGYVVCEFVHGLLGGLGLVVGGVELGALLGDVGVEGGAVPPCELTAFEVEGVFSWGGVIECAQFFYALFGELEMGIRGFWGIWGFGTVRGLCVPHEDFEGVWGFWGVRGFAVGDHGRPV
jgi:hypothetical protein